MICLLCLEDQKNAYKFFDRKGKRMKIASIVETHFWMKPSECDAVSTAICRRCWTKVSDFHQFYKDVEQTHSILMSSNEPGNREQTEVKSDNDEPEEEEKTPDSAIEIKDDVWQENLNNRDDANQSFGRRASKRSVVDKPPVSHKRIKTTIDGDAKSTAGITCNSSMTESSLSDNNIRKLLEKQTELMEKQSELIRNQTFEISQIISFQMLAKNNMLGRKNNSIHQSDTPSKKFKPIDTIEELNAFEKNLKYANFQDECLNEFRLVVNKNDRLNEIDICYVLVDVIFTRKFFTIVSWAGGSKSSNSKVAFRNYHRTMKFFRLLVRTLHPEFSEITCQEFFKRKAICNSTKRAVTEPQRMSRTKQRKKRSIEFINTTECKNEVIYPQEMYLQEEESNDYCVDWLDSE